MPMGLRIGLHLGNNYGGGGGSGGGSFSYSISTNADYDPDTDQYTFTMLRSGGDLTPASSANWAASATLLSGRTPASASDFGGSFPTGTVNFSSGQASKTFVVAGNDLVSPE